jgi:hypothetical protein
MTSFDPSAMDQLTCENSFLASPLDEFSFSPLDGFYSSLLDDPKHIDPSVIGSLFSGDLNYSFDSPIPTSSLSSSDSEELSFDQYETATVDASSALELVDSTSSSSGVANHPSRRSSTESDGSHRVSKGRVAHNLVERKYRNTLNAEMERLGRVIPHIAQLNSHGPDGRPKPSKATILASAVDYITKVEEERKQLTLKNEELGVLLRAVGSARRGR